MRTTVLLALVLSIAACRANRKPSPYNERIEAARLLTERYAHSRLAAWNVRVRAAGDDCGVVLVDTAVILRDSTVEALHYGGGDYGIDGRGIEHFRRDRRFRGVVYRDSTARVWPYDGLSAEEARALKPCGSGRLLGVRRRPL